MNRQKGFALLELALAVLVAMMAAVYTADRFAERGRQIMVEGHVAWMGALHHAVLQYLERHADSLAVGGSATPIVGYVNAWTPTLAELKTAGLLTMGFPLQGARGLGARVQLVQSGDCPSHTCTIEALVYSDAPLGRDALHAYRLSMVAHWLGESTGQGGAVMPQRPQIISGPAFSFPNPLAAGLPVLPPGTVAMAITAEQLGKLAYLRVRDQRDPNFQGAASVAGNLSTEAALYVREHLVVGGQAYAQTLCTSEAAVVRERYGGLLVCRGGQWQSAGGRGGGGYSFNTLSGCAPAAANPITGDCTCPAEYVPVRIADSTSAIPSEGRTRGYICVG